MHASKDGSNRFPSSLESWREKKIIVGLKMLFPALKNKKKIKTQPSFLAIELTLPVYDWYSVLIEVHFPGVIEFVFDLISETVTKMESAETFRALNLKFSLHFACRFFVPNQSRSLTLFCNIWRKLNSIFHNSWQ